MLIMKQAAPAPLSLHEHPARRLAESSDDTAAPPAALSCSLSAEVAEDASAQPAARAGNRGRKARQHRKGTGSWGAKATDGDGAASDTLNLTEAGSTLTPAAAPTPAGAPGNTPRTQCFKTQHCRFWREGCCTRGDTCTYAHTDAELRPKPDLTKTKICARWQQGLCELSAERCLYAHGTKDLRAAVVPAAAPSDGAATAAAATPSGPVRSRQLAATPRKQKRGKTRQAGSPEEPATASGGGVGQGPKQGGSCCDTPPPATVRQNLYYPPPSAAYAWPRPGPDAGPLYAAGAAPIFPGGAAVCAEMPVDAVAFGMSPLIVGGVGYNGAGVAERLYAGGVNSSSSPLSQVPPHGNPAVVAARGPQLQAAGQPLQPLGSQLSGPTGHHPSGPLPAQVPGPAQLPVQLPPAQTQLPPGAQLPQGQISPARLVQLPANTIPAAIATTGPLASVPIGARQLTAIAAPGSTEALCVDPTTASQMTVGGVVGGPPTSGQAWHYVRAESGAVESPQPASRLAIFRSETATSLESVHSTMSTIMSQINLLAEVTASTATDSYYD